MPIRDRIVDLRRVPASELIPHPENWRTHPARQRAILADMLTEVGVADAVIAYERDDGDLQLIDGHLRADVAGDEPVPVLVLDVDEDEARKLLLSLDPLAAMAETSRGRLQELLAGVEANTEGLDELMATLGSPRAFDQLQDQPPAPPRKARTKPGDVWLLGESRVACVDSTDAVAVAAALEGVGPARAIVTDPPYGVSYKNERGDGIANDDLRGPALQQLIAGALKALEPAVAKGTALYMFHGDWERIATQLGCEEAGYGIHATLVWVKNKATLTHADYRFQHEPILYGWRRGARRKWAGGRRPASDHAGRRRSRAAPP